MLSFFIQNPAFTPALSLLLTSFYVFTQHSYCAFCYFSIHLFLITFSKSKKEKIYFKKQSLLSILLSGVFLIILQHHYQIPPHGESPQEGRAVIEIQSIRRSPYRFSSGFEYKVRILCFHDAKEGKCLAKNIPASLIFFSKQPISAHWQYEVKGSLKTIQPYRYSLKIKNKSLWKPLKRVWNLSNHRFKAKKYIQNILKKYVEDKLVRDFFMGIFAGEFNNRILLYAFQKIGLEHLVAISGLHFSILASSLSFFLSSLFSQRFTKILVMLFIASYFLFIGSTPSVIRSCINIYLVLIGIGMKKRHTAFNHFFIAILCITLTQPFFIFQKGFQYSFIITASILLFYSTFKRLVGKIFPHKNLESIEKKKLFYQHFYLLNNYLKKSIALSLSVLVGSLGLTFFYVGSFPLISIFYNLFFPFLASLSLILLLAFFILLTLLPQIAGYIMSFNILWTKHILHIALNSPFFLQAQLKCKTFSMEVLLACLISTFFIGILIKKREEKELIF